MILWVRCQAHFSSIQRCLSRRECVVNVCLIVRFERLTTSIVALSLCNMSEHPRHFCGRWLLRGNSDIWELSASMSIHISWVASTMNWSGFQSKEILSSVKGNLVLLPTKSIKTFFVIQITILMMYVVCKCSILPSRMGEHGEHREHGKTENPKRMLLEERCTDPHNLQ